MFAAFRCFGQTRATCIRALATIAIRSHDPTRLALYEVLSALAVPQQHGVASPSALFAARKDHGRQWPLVAGSSLTGCGSLCMCRGVDVNVCACVCLTHVRDVELRVRLVGGDRR